MSSEAGAAGNARASQCPLLRGLCLVASLPKQPLSFQCHRQIGNQFFSVNLERFGKLEYIWNCGDRQDNIKQKNGDYKELGKQMVSRILSLSRVYPVVF